MGTTKVDNQSDKHLVVRSLEVLEGVTSPGIKTLKDTVAALQQAQQTQAESTSKYYEEAASDNVITPTEKKVLYKEYLSIRDEVTAVQKEAAEAGIPDTDEALVSYVDSWTTLYTLLIIDLKLFDDMTVNTELEDREAFLSTYQNYYRCLTAVRNEIYNWNVLEEVATYYLATSAGSGVTKETAGWTTTVQTVTSTDKYLWTYTVYKNKSSDVISETEPCITGVYGDTGAKGDSGSQGVRAIRYLGKYESAPSSYITGDWYLNTTDGEVYYRTENGWNAIEWTDTTTTPDYRLLSPINDIIELYETFTNEGTEIPETMSNIVSHYMDCLVVGTALIDKLFAKTITVNGGKIECSTEVTSIIVQYYYSGDWHETYASNSGFRISVNGGVSWRVFNSNVGTDRTRSVFFYNYTENNEEPTEWLTIRELPIDNDKYLWIKGVRYWGTAVLWELGVWGGFKITDSYFKLDGATGLITCKNATIDGILNTDTIYSSLIRAASLSVNGTATINGTATFNSVPYVCDYATGGLGVIDYDNQYSNGYINLGNGLGIKWGRVTISSDGLKTVTMGGDPFNTVNYAVVLSFTAGKGSSVYSNRFAIGAKTTSTFKIVYALNEFTPYYYIAIGELST